LCCNVQVTTTATALNTAVEHCIEHYCCCCCCCWLLLLTAAAVFCIALASFAVLVLLTHCYERRLFRLPIVQIMGIQSKRRSFKVPRARRQPCHHEFEFKRSKVANWQCWYVCFCHVKTIVALPTLRPERP
jgi:hypothetical protein